MGGEVWVHGWAQPPQNWPRSSSWRPRPGCDRAGLVRAGKDHGREPAADVVGHLGSASTEMGEALTAVRGALSKVDEAKQAVEDVGQQGLTQVIPTLREQVLAVQVQVASCKEAATAELTALNDYIQRSATAAAGGTSGSTPLPSAVGPQSTARPDAPSPTPPTPTGPPTTPRNADLRRRLQPPDSGSRRVARGPRLLP
jgi:hypothetical protein